MTSITGIVSLPTLKLARAKAVNAKHALVNLGTPQHNNHADTLAIAINKSGRQREAGIFHPRFT